MEKKEYLNEKNYQKTKKKLIFLSLVILVLGVSIGGYLIYTGITKNKNIDSNSVDRSEVVTKLNEAENILKNKRTELEAKGITYDAFTKYTDGEAYDLKIITEALDPDSIYCISHDSINNADISSYCSLKNQLEDIDDGSVEFDKKFEKSGNSKLFIEGGFIIFASLIISLFIYMYAKQREIAAFNVQQMMPVAQEGIEKMAPTIGNAAGEVAKGVASGIKEGLNNNNSNSNQE